MNIENLLYPEDIKFEGAVDYATQLKNITTKPDKEYLKGKPIYVLPSRDLDYYPNAVYSKKFPSNVQSFSLFMGSYPMAGWNSSGDSNSIYLKYATDKKPKRLGIVGYRKHLQQLVKECPEYKEVILKVLEHANEVRSLKKIEKYLDKNLHKLLIYNRVK